MDPVTKSIVNELRNSSNKLKGLDNSCSCHNSIKATRELTFKPNPNLGEGQASERNLEYRQGLLTILKDTVYTPYSKLLKSDKDTDEIITALDGLIEDYIQQAQEYVDTSLTASYHESVQIATDNLKKAAKKQGAKYKPNIPEKPDRLLQIIKLQQNNVEDYGLTLRGRLRSAIQSKQWLDGYGTKE